MRLKLRLLWNRLVMLWQACKYPCQCGYCRDYTWYFDDRGQQASTDAIGYQAGQERLRDRVMPQAEWTAAPGHLGTQDLSGGTVGRHHKQP